MQKRTFLFPEKFVVIIIYHVLRWFRRKTFSVASYFWFINFVASSSPWKITLDMNFTLCTIIIDCVRSRTRVHTSMQREYSRRFSLSLFAFTFSPSYFLLQFYFYIFFLFVSVSEVDHFVCLTVCAKSVLNLSLQNNDCNNNDYLLLGLILSWCVYNIVLVMAKMRWWQSLVVILSLIHGYSSQHHIASLFRVYTHNAMYVRRYVSQPYITHRRRSQCECAWRLRLKSLNNWEREKERHKQSKMYTCSYNARQSSDVYCVQGLLYMLSSVYFSSACWFWTFPFCIFLRFPSLPIFIPSWESSKRSNNPYWNFLAL